MFKQIHEIVFHGNGGYDWETVYNMPLWLRKTTFNLMNEYFEKQNEEAEKQQKSLKPNKNEIAKPNLPNPTYTSKAPRK